MTGLEEDFVAVLRSQCARAFPDTAPLSTAKPYVTWMNVGGIALRYIDNTAANRRMALVQVNVWDTSRAGALALIRSIEDALCAAQAFVATPASEAVSSSEEDLGLYGARQDFTVLGRR